MLSRICHICRIFLVLLVGVAASHDLRSQGVSGHHVGGDDGGSSGFTPNLGQVVDADGGLHPEVLFTASCNNVDIFVAATRISYLYQQADGDLQRWRRTDHDLELCGNKPPIVKLYRMDLELVGSNPNPNIAVIDPTDGVSNFYFAHCPDGILAVPTYRTIELREVYPNIDMILRMTARGIKCDFLVHPGGHPSDIRMRYLGGSFPRVGKDGALRVENPLGVAEETAPLSFQSSGAIGTEASHINDSDARRVHSRWVVNDQGIVGFGIGDYDPTIPMLIDPIRKWSTYYGGNAAEFSDGTDVTDFDRAGDVLVVTSTGTATFPVTIGPAFAGGISDVAVVKMKGDGTRLWATMIGGTGDDRGHGIATDKDRNVFVVGHSASSNFPVASAHQSIYGGGSKDAFVAKLDTNGLRLWATYYGGVVDDDAYGFAVDSTGNPAIVGLTASTNNISGGAAYDLTYNGGVFDGFVAKFSGAGVRQWGTYFGGSSTDVGYSATSDINDNITIAGWTNSTNFPTLRPHQGARNGTAYDAFVAQLSRTGSLRWSTYYGGTGSDGCDGTVFPNPTTGFLSVSSNPRGNILVAGGTNSTDFPVTIGAVQTTSGGGSHDPFVVLFDSAGVRQWATYLGGALDDVAYGVVSGANNSLLVVGSTTSTNFPGITPDAFSATNSGGSDFFIVKINAAGTTRQYATYYGGTNHEQGYGISRDPHGSFVVSGLTNSTNFPVTAGSFQGTLNGTLDDWFITLFCDLDSVSIDVTGPTTFCPGDSVVLKVLDGYTSYLWSNGATSNSIAARVSGNYYVDITNAAGCTVRTDTVRVRLHDPPSPILAPSGTVRLCQGDSVRLDIGPRNFVNYSWYDSSLTTLKLSGPGLAYRAMWVKTSGTFRVIVVDTTGCRDTTAVVTVVTYPKPAPVAIRPTRDSLSTCAGEPFLLSADRDVAPGETFTWLGGTPGVGRTFAPTTSGTYTLKVTSAAGCSTVSKTVVVRVHPKPIVLINANPSTTICEGDSVQLDAYGVGLRSFVWSTGDTTPTIRVKSGGLYRVEAADSNGCKDTISRFITVQAMSSPMIAPLGPISLCAGDSIELDAGPNYNEYLWSTGGTTRLIWVRDSGNYSVQVRDGALSCLGHPSNVVLLRINPRPSAALFGPLAICVHDTATYVARKAKGVRYEWSVSGAGGIILSGNSSDSVVVVWGGIVSTGSVRLTVTDTSTNCTTDTIITVAVGSALKPALQASGSTNLCPGGQVTLDAGGGYTSYTWVDATGRELGGARTLTVSDSGVYLVRVVKGSCSGQSDPIVVRFALPPRPVITSIGDTTICPGGTVVLDAGRFAKYQWTPPVQGSNGQQIVVGDSGLYQVMVTDSNGCTGLSQVVRVRVVDPPHPTITGAPFVCINSTTTYAVTPVAGSSYLWTGPGNVGAIVSGQGTPTVTVRWGTAGAGFMVVTEKSPRSNCTGISAPYRVDVGTTLRPTITSDRSSTICDGDSLTLRVPSGFISYAWSDATGALLSSVDSLVVRTGGTYSVEVSSGNCNGTAAITITQKPRFTPQISGARSVCEGDTLLLTTDSGYADYLWSTGERGSTIRVATSGVYSVRLTDVDGCTEVAPSISITFHPLPTATITRVGNTLVAAVGVGYQWYIDGGEIAGATTRDWFPRSNGDYSVRVTDTNGCSAISVPEHLMSRASATILIRDYEASPGERISIPLELINGENLDRNGIRSFTATLRFNKSLLLPTGSFAATIVGDDRILTLHGDIPSPTRSSQTVATLECIVALGDVAGTPITIDSFAFVEDSAITTTINGSLRLTGLCITGGRRLVEAEGTTLLRPLRPNPAVGTTEVDYEVAEDGLTMLYLVDLLGVVTPIVHAELMHGRYLATFDVSGLPSGLYICVLQTPTERLSRVVRIEK